MKLKINKGYDLSSISVFSPQSRMPTGASNGVESSSSQTASQFRSQQAQQSQMAQFSQNSQDENLTNKKMPGQENSMRRTSNNLMPGQEHKSEGVRQKLLLHDGLLESLRKGQDEIISLLSALSEKTNTQMVKLQNDLQALSSSMKILNQSQATLPIQETRTAQPKDISYQEVHPQEVQLPKYTKRDLKEYEEHRKRKYEEAKLKGKKKKKSLWEGDIFGTRGVTGGGI